MQATKQKTASHPPLRLWGFVGHFCWWFSSLLAHHPSPLTYTNLIPDILLPLFTIIAHKHLLTSHKQAITHKKLQSQHQSYLTHLKTAHIQLVHAL